MFQAVFAGIAWWDGRANSCSGVMCCNTVHSVEGPYGHAVMVWDLAHIVFRNISLLPVCLFICLFIHVLLTVAKIIFICLYETRSCHVVLAPLELDL